MTGERRWIPHPAYPKWPAHNGHVKAMLGLPKRLGPRPAAPVLVGHLVDSAGERVEAWDLPNRGFHRIHLRYGDRFIPAGRLHQTRV